MEEQAKDWQYLLSLGSLFVAMAAFYVSWRSLTMNAKSLEVSNIIGLTKDIERLSEELERCETQDAMKRKLRQNINYMEMIALLINNNRLPHMVAKQMSHNLWNFLRVFHSEDLILDVINEDRKEDPHAYEEIETFLRKQNQKSR